MNWMPQDWSGWAGMVAVMSFAGAMVYFLLRAKLGAEFVQRTELMELHKQNVEKIDRLSEDHGKIVHKVSNLQQIIVALPTRVDLQRTEDKVGEMSGSLAMMRGTLDGVETAMDRAVVQLNLLVRAQMEKEKP